MQMVNLVDRSVVTVTPDATVAEAARKMKDHNVGSVIVLDGERVVGILTDRDIVMRIAAGEFRDEEQPVGSFMTSNPICVRCDEDLEAGLAKMRAHCIRRLPVLNDEGDLIGVVALDDLLVHMGRTLAEAADLVRAEVAGIPEEAWRPRWVGVGRAPDYGWRAL